ncbi:hypothetical protein [Methanogenium organophilum]|uniref:Uncharacterized protein n=1 Tax=Methanogenium organophilum TaxID=2199 RepID=A0A9X9S3E9_METOG|nr:hypothetical protein [Methanogenium organophilum]WAI00961.1 hypothetical protein OU421_11150 [Methanogenium organophilum]
MKYITGTPEKIQTKNNHTPLKKTGSIKKCTKNMNTEASGGSMHLRFRVWFVVPIIPEDRRWYGYGRNEKLPVPCDK